MKFWEIAQDKRIGVPCKTLYNILSDDPKLLFQWIIKNKSLNRHKKTIPGIQNPKKKITKKSISTGQANIKKM